MVRWALAIAVVVQFAGQAQAWNFCDARYVPPAVFDREPSVKYSVIKVPDDMLAGFCGIYGNPTLGACAEQVSADEWWIKVRASLTGSELTCVLRHEKGHLNGWEHGPSYWRHDGSRDAMQRIIDRYLPAEAAIAAD